VTPSRRSAAYALAVIFLANFLSYLDRQIVSALEKELTGAFNLSGAEFGFLWTSFTLGYMVFSPVVGFLTDRHSRPKILAACVFVWSLATLASGWAASKQLLIASRFFIGIGEAGCLVIGPTLLADYFSREVRGKALAAFFLALPLGGTSGYLVGGFVSHHFGWREAFYAAGLPGFVVAALIWFLADPPRGGREDGAPDAGPIHGLRPYLNLLKNRTLILIILAQAFAVIILVPLLHFGVEFFETKHGMSKQQATTTLGAIALAGGAAGNLLSGYLGDRLARRTRGAYALLAALGYVGGLPFLLIGFLADSKAMMIPALAVGAFCYFLCMPAVNTQIANVVSPRERAMAYALAVFILHLLGDTGAPIAFGKVAELVGKQTAFVAFSLALLPAAYCCLRAARLAPQDEERFAGRKSPPAAV
jgi:MFS family permease